MRGQRVVVTGGTSGLGWQSALALGSLGARVVVTSRWEERALRTRDELAAEGLRAEAVVLDLSSLDSVEQAAREISAGPPVTVLVNNAGIGGGRGRTLDGFELVMGTNYVGAFHLTGLLETALNTASLRPRVVNVSSNAHFGAKREDVRRLTGTTRSLTGFPEYRASKLAQVLWSRELARRWPWADVFCVHPGMVATPIWGRLPQPIRWWMTRRMLSPEEGARTQVACASDPALLGSTGFYWERCARREPSGKALDDALAASLWATTESAVEQRRH